jgi:thymidylate kinase
VHYGRRYRELADEWGKRGNLSENLSGHIDHLTRANATEVLGGAVSRGIRFCSWKSNSHLQAGLAGDTDVDILVAPDQYEELRRHLLDSGCIEVAPPPDGRHEGMSHFLGLDDQAKIFHLHVHDRLVLGQRYAKNYAIPLTEVFLESAKVSSGVPQADPSIELVVLASRAMFKYRVRDLVKDTLRIRTPGVPLATIEEIEWCQDQLDEKSLAFGLDRCGEMVPPDLVREFLDTIGSRPRSGIRIWSMRWKLERALSTYRRRSRLTAAGIYFWFLVTSRIRPRWNPKLRTEGRGLSVALVGADGAGKTTISSELASWLGNRIAVSRYYMGSKEPSRTTSASYMAFRILRRGHRDTTSFLSESSLVRRFIAKLRDAMLAGHHLSVARDRLRRMRRTRRDLDEGYVVLLDRYPLESLGDSRRLRLLDGPSIETDGDGLLRSLAEREAVLYQQFDLPDAFILLRVDPQVAITRKPDHDLDTVTEKTLGVDEVERILVERGESWRVHTVDANQPWPIPLDAARRAVWSALRDRRDPPR